MIGHVFVTKTFQAPCTPCSMVSYAVHVLEPDSSKFLGHKLEPDDATTLIRLLEKLSSP